MTTLGWGTSPSVVYKITARTGGERVGEKPTRPYSAVQQDRQWSSLMTAAAMLPSALAFRLKFSSSFLWNVLQYDACAVLPTLIRRGYLPWLIVIKVILSEGYSMYAMPHHRAET
ncbi:hypothetical protein [Phyllobacterium sp. OV277]|jgi:hypothetical protein|uniref:hypothetical protein n=1 Tax=Phyllobacterium sp. OV277 TaxID=1882772 RepID=UPI00088A0D80|nr:hypothetical protein [Phyllobacterium sp. OV277]SDP29171.1 hypothetical protein SAMN05443582_104116 [Phyllobacterium sp. OV277]